MFNGNLRKDIGENMRDIVGSHDYKTPVVEGPGQQAAPQCFSCPSYEKMTGGKAPVAKAVDYQIGGGGGKDTKNDSVHFQSRHHEVAHSETHKDVQPQERISEYRQSFDIASGSRNH